MGATHDVCKIPPFWCGIKSMWGNPICCKDYFLGLCELKFTLT